MAGEETETIAVTPELRALLRDAMNLGTYASESELISEALRDWQQWRTGKDEALQILRRLWEEGIASGLAAPLDTEAIKREGRRRLALADKL